jgi:ActD protein
MPEPRSDTALLVALYEPTTRLQPIVQQLRDAGVKENALEVVSDLPLGDAITQESVHVPLYIITIVSGLIGIGVGVFFAGATAAFYPLMTGGKPILSAPVIGIVSYETMMLLAIVMTFLAMVTKIVYGARARLEDMPQIGEGQIALVVRVNRADPLFDVSKAVLQTTGAREVLTR